MRLHGVEAKCNRTSPSTSSGQALDSARDDSTKSRSLDSSLRSSLGMTIPEEFGLKGSPRRAARRGPAIASGYGQVYVVGQEWEGGLSQEWQLSRAATFLTCHHERSEGPAFLSVFIKADASCLEIRRP